MADRKDQKKRKLFCTSQVLSLLNPPEGEDVKPYLSGDRFWHERHAGRGGEELDEENPWQPLSRLDTKNEPGEAEPGLLTRLSAKGDIKRLAIVCTGGYGKSANLEYLSAMLTTVGLVPFHFVLDEKGQKLPDSAVTFWAKTLPEVFSRGKNSELQIDQPKAQRILEKCRASGRLVLLFDSIDQATPNGLAVVSGILSDPAWGGCPVIITGRPHAIWQHWDRLIRSDVRKWDFVRVEPLAEEQRHLLLGPDGVDQAERLRLGEERYEQLPESGRQLMENPRNIEYVRELADRKPRAGRRQDEEPTQVTEYRLADLRTASHLFAGAVDNLVTAGFADATARRLGYYDPKIATPDEPAHFHRPLAMSLLAALAYAMYCWPAPEVDDEDEFRPNVSHVPPDRLRELLRGKDRKGGVLKLLADADIPDRPETIEQLEHDVKAVSALNARLDFCLLDRSTDSGLRWHDRTLQEFLAAWWLAKYATADDCERLKDWRYDNRMKEAKSLYSPLWGFLVEMPRAVRTGKWFALMEETLFEHGASRCCEMIYRCHQTFETLEEKSKPKGVAVIARWQGEFAGMTGPVADSLRPDDAHTHFKRCPKNPADDGKSFLMGSPEGETYRGDNEQLHAVVVSPFRMSQGPVTNAEYELFDPGHEAERAFTAQVSAEELGRHPVVNVDWWEGWCFASWAGCRLPTEAEWEYAARGGTAMTPEESLAHPFYWGNILNGTAANCDGNRPYGTTAKGEYLNRTSVVGAYAAVSPPPWGLVDVIGNVWEWCGDWYDRYPDGEGVDPMGPESGSSRVFRGGSWLSSAGRCRAADRGGDSPVNRSHDLGFRLAAGPSGPGGS